MYRASAVQRREAEATMCLLGETLRPPVKRRATWTGLLVALSLAAALTTQTHLDAGVLGGATVEETAAPPVTTVEGGDDATSEMELAVSSSPASSVASTSAPSASTRSGVEDLIVAG